MRDRMTRSMQNIWDRLASLLTGAKQDQPTSLLMLRLENLDLLTSHLGKVGLGQLLVALCMRLSHAIRPQDPVQIIAPGLFAVALKNRDDAEALRIARRLQVAGQSRIAAGGAMITPVLSCVVMHHASAAGAVAAQMVDAARHKLADLPDDALGRVQLYDFTNSTTPASVPDSIAEAVALNQIEAYFQPQTSCQTGAVTGFEALARWHHPTRGLLSPAAFMPTMTARDHAALAQTMLRQSLSAIRYWDACGHHVPTVSINIAKSELAEADFAESVLWELDRQGVPPARLAIEVLESIGVIASGSAAHANLSQLVRAGCQLDLDDFGTGYACFDTIRQYGIHRLKIDRSFVSGCDIDPGQQRMILAMLALAERLGITALAEGVETREEHSFLAQMGCDEAQGYAIARPMPLEDSAAFLVRHNDRNALLPGISQRSAG